MSINFIGLVHLAVCLCSTYFNNIYNFHIWCCCFEALIIQNPCLFIYKVKKLFKKLNVQDGVYIY